MSNYLSWTKANDGCYYAAADGRTYKIILEPRPTDRYVASIDNEAQRIMNGPQAGTRLLFWYLREAKQHCQNIADESILKLTHTENKSSYAVGDPQSTAPYPNENQVAAAVKSVSAAKGRSWSIVDDAWKVLILPASAPSAHTIGTLETYVLEIAKWGSLRRWLSESDLRSAGLALWDVRENAAALRCRHFTDEDVSLAVIVLYQTLMDRMQKRGVVKRHYSWASKILHWLLPDSVPVLDSLVLQELHIKTSGFDAYRQIIAWEYGCAVQLQPFSKELLGEIPEMTLLAAIDNYLWWTAKKRMLPSDLPARLKPSVW